MKLQFSVAQTNEVTRTYWIGWSVSTIMVDMVFNQTHGQLNLDISSWVEGRLGVMNTVGGHRGAQALAHAEFRNIAFKYCNLVLIRLLQLI